MLLFSKIVSENSLFLKNFHFYSLTPNSETLTASYIRANYSWKVIS